LVKHFQIKKARCEERAFANKFIIDSYTMADFTALICKLRHDQIYNLIVFIEAKIVIILNYQSFGDLFSFSKILWPPYFHFTSPPRSPSPGREGDATSYNDCNRLLN
jgi:hypothetical protein